MATVLHTFTSIFTDNFKVGEQEIKISKIIIPKIQRDYAQGRRDNHISKIRERFLESLKTALTEKPITLDFVYGDIDPKGVMTPLDGQQRLTTLFLLYWYAVKKENVTKDISFLSKFSYETRSSARVFCSYLVSKFEPSFSIQLSKEIINQSWFPLSWEKDPTIDSMLVMLDAIQMEFADIPNLWDKLQSNAISFYFLAIDEMGLTDELYIKMNSRGKPLTTFEHFKAEFEQELGKYNRDIAKRIGLKIDLDWTDIIWKFKDSQNKVIDDMFLRYFRFICDIICYKNDSTPQGKNFDEFELIKNFFNHDNINIENNINLLETYFDCWKDFKEKNDFDDFFKSFTSKIHEDGKIILDYKDINLFSDCLHSYAQANSNGNRPFPLNRIVLLFSVITYLLNKDKIKFNEFQRRIRIVNNLLKNSPDELSDSENRSSGNRLPAILKQVESIILNYTIDSSIGNNFNKNQLEEESTKIVWLKSNPQFEKALFKLEDNQLLYGQIGIIGLERPEYFERFEKLFENDFDLIDCALLSIGNYFQQENSWRYQAGSSIRLDAWQNLFHKSKNQNYLKTQECLKTLLNGSKDQDADYLSSIINKYVSECEKLSEFDWRYYYIRYPVFRPGSYGKIYISDMSLPYEMFIMQTKNNTSENTYSPFLKENDLKRLSRDSYGTKIIYDDFYIMSKNYGYVKYDIKSNQILKEVKIKQNESGVDIENRMEKYSEILK